jgi:hypothetical protein
MGRGNYIRTTSLLPENRHFFCAEDIISDILFVCKGIRDDFRWEWVRICDKWGEFGRGTLQSARHTRLGAMHYGTTVLLNSA